MTKKQSILKKRGAIIAFKALAILFLILGTAKSVSASTIYSQLDYSQEMSGASTTNSRIFYNTFTTVGTSTVGNIRAIFDASQGGFSFSDLNQAQIDLVDNATLGQSGVNQYFCVANLSTADKNNILAGQAIVDEPLTYLNTSTGNCNLKSGVTYRVELSFGNGYSGKTMITYGGILGFSDIYYELAGNTIYSNNSPLGSTRIIDFTPEDKAYIGTSTNTSEHVNFSIHAYINPQDIGNYLGIQLTLHNKDQNVLLLSSFSPADIYLLNNFQATSSGDFYFSTSTIIASGNYQIEASIKTSFLGAQTIFNAFSPINQTLDHQFTVDQGTFIGNLTQNSVNELNQIFASTTATTTAATAQSCNVLSPGAFNITTCGAFLFEPGGPYLADTLQQLRDGFATRIPWGYFTRAYSIMTSSSTSALPVFTATIPTGASTSSDVVVLQNFDIGDTISGGATLLNSATDPHTGENIQQVATPVVQLVVDMGVLFLIIKDLLKMQHSAGEIKGQNEKRKLS